MNRTKQQDLFNLLGGIYSAVFFLGAMAANKVQPVIATERAVLYREKAAGMYSSLSYAFAQVKRTMIFDTLKKKKTEQMNDLKFHL